MGRSLALWKVVCFLLIQESTAAPVGSHNIQYTFGPVIDEPRQVGVVDYKNDAHPFTGSEALPAGHPSTKRPRRAVSSNSAAESEYQAFRVVQHAVEQSALSTAEANFLNNVLMPAAIAFFADTLKVFPVSGKLGKDYHCSSSYSAPTPNKCASAITSSTCGSLVTVPTSHLTGKDQYGGTEYCGSCSSSGSCSSCTTYDNQGGGVSNADFVIYVTAQTTSPCPSSSGTGTLAFASSCQTDQYDRPTVGYVNFCPVQIQVAAAGTSSYEDQLSTAIHEITHALGFTSGNYAYWRDHANSGQPRTPRDSDGEPTGTVSLFGQSTTAPATTTLNSFTERGNTVWKLVTPKILEKARAQFGCSTLNGAEIENQGGSGTAGSHWEKRLFMNDFMSGVSAGLRPAYTPMTFALLEDSGWYYVNWGSSNIEEASWLKDAGCTAVTDKCLTAGSSDPPAVVSGGTGFFCNTAGVTGCTVDRSAGGYCSISTWGSNLDTAYQYFTAATKGGGLEVADFCPYMAAYSNQKCIDTGNSASGRLDIYSATSKCFESTVGGYSSEAAACYQYSCSSSGVLSITVGTSGSTTTVTCSTGGQQLTVSNGYVKCPADLTTICAVVTSAPTTAPTAAPTAAATTSTSSSSTATNQAVIVTQLEGVTAASWDSATESNFKTTVASKAGAICGSSSNAGCTSSDVSVTSVARRAVTVTFSINVYSASAATSAQATLSTYMNSTGFITDLQATGGGLASVSSATVISSSTATTASGDSDGSSTVVIVVVVLVVILCFGVIGFLVWYFVFKSAKVVPKQVAIIQPDDAKREDDVKTKYADQAADPSKSQEEETVDTTGCIGMEAAVASEKADSAAGLAAPRQLPPLELTAGAKRAQRNNRCRTKLPPLGNNVELPRAPSPKVVVDRSMMRMP